MTAPRPPLDTAPTEDVVDRVLTSQQDALAAVRAVAPRVAAAAELVAGRIAAGGRVLLVATDPTAERVLALVAADLDAEFGLAPGAVRRTATLAEDRPTARDAVVVVATTAGANGPAAELAAAARARSGVVLVTTDRSAGAATAAAAEVVVVPDLDDGPVRGLDRLGAATALKAVLDALTTAVLARHGRVHGDLPVDLVAADDVTRERVVAMVAEIAEVDEATARRAAGTAGHDVRTAVLALAGGLEPAPASMLASGHRTLRAALADLPRRPPERRPVGPPPAAGGTGTLAP